MQSHPSCLMCRSKVSLSALVAARASYTRHPQRSHLSPTFGPPSFMDAILALRGRGVGDGYLIDDSASRRRQVPKARSRGRSGQPAKWTSDRASAGGPSYRPSSMSELSRPDDDAPRLTKPSLRRAGGNLSASSPIKASTVMPRRAASADSRAASSSTVIDMSQAYASSNATTAPPSGPEFGLAIQRPDPGFGAAAWIRDRHVEHLRRPLRSSSKRFGAPNDVVEMAAMPNTRTRNCSSACHALLPTFLSLASGARPTQPSSWVRLSVRTTSYGRLRSSSGAAPRPLALADAASDDHASSSRCSSLPSRATISTVSITSSTVKRPSKEPFGIPKVKPRSSWRITRLPFESRTNSPTQQSIERRAFSRRRSRKPQIARRPTG